MNTFKKIALTLPILVGCPMVALAATDSSATGDTSASRQDPTNWEMRNGSADENNADTTRARMEESKTSVQFRQMIDSSAEVYRAVVRGQDQQVPNTVLKDARCIAVLPGVVTGALVVGGTHGEGLVSCRTQSGWSQPAAITLNSGSIGIQAGAKKTDLVLFFQTPEAEEALKKGSFEFGSDISASAGKYESAYDTQGAGVITYSRTNGVFAGASVNGSKVGKDEDAMSRDYGRPVHYIGLLNGKENPGSTSETERFTSLLPS